MDRGIETIVKEKEMERRKVKERKLYGNVNSRTQKPNFTDNKLRLNQMCDSTPTTEP